MPHFILEYTDNIKEEGKIQELLKKVNDVLLSFPEIIPIGGLRSRAIELNHYIVADGSHDDAFVHATLKLGKGRSEEDIKKISDAVFNQIQEHFQVLYNKRYLALSMEVYEFQKATYKLNNIHNRYK
ncbi:5-carboxymethyl-2-hydroxymuconate Delta-isomerase [Pallidibacillus thermolactis]|jgi:5-carboxymethyl-2-hydroxymuconate isomerase|uniref:5-carboxymethyl-2-hydroxymuconate Delta-isomerase n=1 Tax=Pallidibacillus thermolactis TaxID=251051 RepID=UPI00156B27CF|nr:5-carboxymethyl-2-hydroxymuconate Delta-isomerase [Pallidibacillus thermolactis]MED1672814.1 5-carboxymethyl-2-hydroxymuconate Delta-isomerase [Pallidibacillus thermolactis subsp. kokeshiiformis]